jgi:predicted DNA-binding protein (MmcQ/YjbR family)
MDIEFLQKLCSKLPSATEDIKWGHDLVFSVGQKMFCVVSVEQPYRCSFKVPDEEFEELSVRPGFIPAPYMARAKWVQLTDLTKLSKNEWQHYINQSYELVKAKLTKKVKGELGIL